MVTRATANKIGSDYYGLVEGKEYVLEKSNLGLWLVYDKGSLVQNNGNYTILKHPKLGTLRKTKFLADDPDALDYALHMARNERKAG